MAQAQLDEVNSRLEKIPKDTQQKYKTICWRRNGGKSDLEASQIHAGWYHSLCQLCQSRLKQAQTNASSQYNTQSANASR